MLSATAGLHVSQVSDEKITANQLASENSKSFLSMCPGTDHPLFVKFLVFNFFKKTAAAEAANERIIKSSIRDIFQLINFGCVLYTFSV